MTTRRIDPIFGLATPILFAHRGGAREAPESTEAGFRHALGCGTDVLELDVQLTRDEKIVVWHGPKLTNVRLEVEDVSGTPRTRFDIIDYEWEELENKAWVQHPENNETVHTVPKNADRRLMTLETFMQMFPDAKLNIELKERFTTAHLDAFIDILVRHNPDRVGVVASNRNEHLLEAFRQRTDNRFATNLPLPLLLEEELESFLGDIDESLRRRAAELPHPHLLSPSSLIEDVRKAGGSSYIFLTAIPFVKALDRHKGSPSAEALFEILNRGVDGIMTDRPADVRLLMDQWISDHPM